jgi:hypothetical protein
VTSQDPRRSGEEPRLTNVDTDLKLNKPELSVVVNGATGS